MTWWQIAVAAFAAIFLTGAGCRELIVCAAEILATKEQLRTKLAMSAGVALLMIVTGVVFWLKALEALLVLLTPAK